MLVLPTTSFAPQNADLDADDLGVAWALLGAFRRRRMLAIYNCGLLAGASQKHKHLQIVPLVGEEEGRELWPARVTGVGERVVGVGFAHFAARIEGGVSVEGVCALHQCLLTAMHVFLMVRGREGSDSFGYNIALCRDWMVLIPRRAADVDGVSGANALGMLGVVSIGTRAEREEWTRLRYTEYLKLLGFPWV